MTYAHDETIEKATVLFWKKGFQGAGMRDIQEALDMRPGSIYARFQSKEGLFKLVVEHYVQQSQAALQEVAESPEPIKALRAFFMASLMCQDDQRFMRQCLLVRSVTELELLGSMAKKAVIDGMGMLRESFENIVKHAVVLNALPYDTPISRSADWLQNQFVGLRTYAMLQSDDKCIEEMIEKVLFDLSRQWSTPHHAFT